MLFSNIILFVSGITTIATACKEHHRPDDYSDHQIFLDAKTLLDSIANNPNGNKNRTDVVDYITEKYSKVITNAKTGLFIKELPKDKEVEIWKSLNKPQNYQNFGVQKENGWKVCNAALRNQTATRKRKLFLTVRHALSTQNLAEQPLQLTDCFYTNKSGNDIRLLDSPLAPAGLLQVAALKEKLQSESPNKVKNWRSYLGIDTMATLVSPNARALETALGIDLREAEFEELVRSGISGEAWNYRTPMYNHKHSQPEFDVHTPQCKSEFYEDFPEAMSKGKHEATGYRADINGGNYFEGFGVYSDVDAVWRQDGGENDESLKARAYITMALSFIHKPKDNIIGIVTHSEIVNTFAKLLFEKNFESGIRVENAEINGFLVEFNPPN
eukprot:Pgem_evm1s4707